VGLEYLSPGVPSCGPLKPLAVLVVAPRVHLANSFALGVALALLNELINLQLGLDDDVMVFQHEVGCCVVATLNPPVKAPVILRHLPFELAGREPALATRPRAGVLLGTFLALLNPTGERVQRQAAVLHLLYGTFKEDAAAVGSG